MSINTVTFGEKEKNMHVRNFWFVVALKLMAGLGASIGLLVQMGAAQEGPPPQVNAVAAADAVSSGKEEKSVRIYRVRHANCQMLSKILAAVIPDAQVAVDSTTNGIVVMASASEHGRLEQLIQELDVSPPEDEIKIFSLVNVEADVMLGAFSAIADSSKVRLGVDLRTNSLLAAGSASDLSVIEALVLKLDKKPDGLPEKTFRVRIVWFAEGSPGGEAIKADEELGAVLQELSKIGIEELRPIGQTMVSTAVGGTFQVDCSAMLSAGTADLKIHGDLNLRQFVPHLAIDISAERSQAAENVAGAAAGRVQLVNLSTEIVAPLGHYVVLGITPVNEKTLAFAVQVHTVD